MRSKRLGESTGWDRKRQSLSTASVGGKFEEALQDQSLYKLQLATRVVDKKQVLRRALPGAGEYLFAQNFSCRTT